MGKPAFPALVARLQERDDNEKRDRGETTAPLSSLTGYGSRPSFASRLKVEQTLQQRPGPVRLDGETRRCTQQGLETGGLRQQFRQACRG